MLELVVVIAILGMLAAIILPAIQHVRESTRMQECCNRMRKLGDACHVFHRVYGCFPRNTVRPRGTTPVDGEPPGSLWNWHSGTYESWHREIMRYIDQPQARVQDAVPELACLSDPRGPEYKVPDYGFTWYVGVYSNPQTVNNGIIIDDSDLKQKQTITIPMVQDGLSNTILLAERPPSADGKWGWWDSRCCIEDNISPVRGNNKPFSSGKHGKCPNPTVFETRDWQDRCAFNSIWSCHPVGANFYMADGSARTINYDADSTLAGGTTLLEALASRWGKEVAHLP